MPPDAPALPFSTDRFSLVGQTALVTGASRGIGAALSLALAGAGADVVLAGRSLVSLGETARAVETLGRRATTLSIDVSDVASIDAAFASLDLPHGVDVLVNNAGFEEVRPAIDVDEALWDRILDTNLKGAFFCARAFARLPAEAGRMRSIVNLCSLTSEVGIATATPYGSSKTGLVGMTRALAVEWASRGIRVNGIGPGYFRTAMTESFYDDAAWAEATREKIPLGRLGQLDDLMGAVVFLCAPASAYVTGQVLYVDGGMLAGL